ncbi:MULTISPECIES: hypothetical protein [unclassified Methylocaldum]|jgi:hypothetical protein|uniref:hypothetical protein n=1 Tax=unclassified Methylocaldum TaxID=2622260 RepID=UPI00111C01BF|nr:hypothetical protein [Methylocaldum sp. RMAD-M]MBP1153075.1 hypothetical protein [Methylocaldum sp. RMAD-M]MVF24147.1 hypothetical protein [Methylocaldum sp. BRCS4]
MPLKMIEGGKQHYLDEAWKAIEQFAITGDPSHMEKLYEIDALIAPRGHLRAVPLHGDCPLKVF